MVGRKNDQGSRAPWAATLAAMIGTLVETARQHGRDPLTEVTRYLEACAAAGGHPLTGDALAPFQWGATGPPKEDPA